jgi:hypothetical protein
VLRDRQWWASVGYPAAVQFWADVQAARQQSQPQAQTSGWMGAQNETPY